MPQTADCDIAIDNDHVRVTAWTFQKGEQTGEHRHELPYVIVPLTGGRLRIESGQESTQTDLTSGGCYFREAGAQHDVFNDGKDELIFVEI